MSHKLKIVVVANKKVPLTIHDSCYNERVSGRDGSHKSFSL